MTADFDDRFVAAMDERQWPYERIGDGIYRVRINGQTLTINSRNVRAEAIRDDDAGAIDRFLDRAAAPLRALPPWAEASVNLFPMIDSTAVELGPENVSRELSDHARTVLVHYAPKQGMLFFVRDSDLAAWRVSADDAWAAADQSFRAVVAGTRVELIKRGDLVLGMLHAPEPYKASMILSPALKSQLPEELGWPVLAVAPARDFVYLFRKDDEEALARLGTVVVREFRGSGYPVSPEVWELSDDGARAIGAYPVE